MQLEKGLEAVTIGCLSRQIADAPAWPMDEIQVFLAAMRREMNNHKLHGKYSL
jgi:hypothetical protein